MGRQKKDIELAKMIETKIAFIYLVTPLIGDPLAQFNVVIMADNQDAADKYAAEIYSLHKVILIMSTRRATAI